MPWLRANDPVLADTLQAYLDSFGDIAAAAGFVCTCTRTRCDIALRRIEKILTRRL